MNNNILLGTLLLAIVLNIMFGLSPVTTWETHRYYKSLQEGTNCPEGKICLQPSAAIPHPQEVPRWNGIIFYSNENLAHTDFWMQFFLGWIFWWIVSFGFWLVKVISKFTK